MTESFSNNKEGGLDKRAELVKGLKEKGIEDLEVRKAFDEWSIAREKEVQKANSMEAQINHEVDLAKLYAEGDYIDAALDTLDKALYMLEEEERQGRENSEIKERIKREIALLESVE
jgi:hypothetical protein